MDSEEMDEMSQYGDKYWESSIENKLQSILSKEIAKSIDGDILSYLTNLEYDKINKIENLIKNIKNNFQNE